MRDLTDAMYSPKSKPFVSHEEGTELIIQHIEKHRCPTVATADLKKEPPTPRRCWGSAGGRLRGTHPRATSTVPSQGREEGVQGRDVTRARGQGASQEGVVHARRHAHLLQEGREQVRAPVRRAAGGGRLR